MMPQHSITKKGTFVFKHYIDVMSPSGLALRYNKKKWINLGLLNTEDVGIILVIL